MWREEMKDSGWNPEQIRVKVQDVQAIGMGRIL